MTDLSSIRMRYANYADSKCELLVDGKVVADISLPGTGDSGIWNTVEAPLKLSQGKHTVRLKVAKGNICVNWLKFD